MQIRSDVAAAYMVGFIHGLLTGIVFILR